VGVSCQDPQKPVTVLENGSLSLEYDHLQPQGKTCHATVVLAAFPEPLFKAQGALTERS
jgi:hypothetical protein